MNSFFILFCFNTYSQTDTFRLKDPYEHQKPNQPSGKSKPAKKASTSNCDFSFLSSILGFNTYLVRQEFTVFDKKTKEEYTTNNQEYFGFQYALAFGINDKLLMPKSILQPWEYDKNFVKSKSQYDAKLSDFYYINIANGKQGKIADKKLVAKDNLDLSIFYPIPPTGKSYALTNEVKDAQGFIIVYTVQNMNDRFETTKTDSYIMPYALAKETKSEASIDLSEYGDNVIGGGYFYVHPKDNVLEFQLHGLLERKSNGWVINRCKTSASSLSESEVIITKKKKK